MKFSDGIPYLFPEVIFYLSYFKKIKNKFQPHRWLGYQHHDLYFCQNILNLGVNMANNQSSPVFF